MLSHCQNCLRPLTDPNSRRIGFGPDCAEQLRHQQQWIDAGQAAESDGLADSTLIVLGRILRRQQNKILLYSEDELVPEVVIHSLNKIRRDYERRVKFLANQGQLTVPEPVYQVAA